MCLFRVCFCIILLMSVERSELTEAKEEEWESPLSGFFSREGSPQINVNNQEPVPSIKEGENLPNVDQDQEISSSVCSSFFPRFVNVLLKAIAHKDHAVNDHENKEISIDAHVSQKALKVLQSFGSGEDVPCDELDESFISIFEPRGFDFMPDIGEHTRGSFDYIFGDVPRFILMMSILLISCVIMLILKKLSRSSVTVIIFFTYYFLSVGMEIFSQYEDLYARQMLAFEEMISAKGKEKIPDACFPSKSSYWTGILSFVSTDDSCGRYLKFKKNLWSEIDIERAFTKPVIGLFISNLPELGDKAGLSIKNFSGHFAFPYNWILAAVLLWFSFKSFTSVVISGVPFHSISKVGSWAPMNEQREIPSGSDSRTQHSRPQVSSTQIPLAPQVPTSFSAINYHFHGLGNGLQEHVPHVLSNTFPKKALLSKEMRENQKQKRNRKKVLLTLKKDKKNELGLSHLFTKQVQTVNNSSL